WVRLRLTIRIIDRGGENADLLVELMIDSADLLAPVFGFIRVVEVGPPIRLVRVQQKAGVQVGLRVGIDQRVWTAVGVYRKVVPGDRLLDLQAVIRESGDGRRIRRFRHPDQRSSRRLSAVLIAVEGVQLTVSFVLREDELVE